jgi:hypothetical protein
MREAIVRRFQEARESGVVQGDRATERRMMLAQTMPAIVNREQAVCITLLNRQKHRSIRCCCFFAARR